MRKGKEASIATQNESRSTSRAIQTASKVNPGDPPSPRVKKSSLNQDAKKKQRSANQDAKREKRNREKSAPFIHTNAQGGGQFLFVFFFCFVSLAPAPLSITFILSG